MCNFERGALLAPSFWTCGRRTWISIQTKNDRLDIPEEESYSEIKEITRHGNIDTYMAQEIRYGKTELEIIGWDIYIYKCAKCIHQDMRPIPIRNLLSHAHRECAAGRVISPYCP